MLPGATLNASGHPLFIQLGQGDQGGLQMITPSNQLVSTGLTEEGFYLSHDRQERLLFGSQNKGLFIQTDPDCYTPECWQVIGPEKGFWLINVISAVQDAQGRYWMGRSSTGLAVYLPDQDTVLSFLAETQQLSTQIWSMQIDREERFWVGTGTGLALFSPPAVIDSTFRPDEYLQPVGANVLPREAIRALDTLDDRYLIIGSSGGVALLDLQSFNRQPERPVIYNFDKAAGYNGQATEQDAIWVDAQKDIWIANDRGITRFNMDLFLPDTTPPRVFITGVSSYGEQFPLTGRGKLRLPQQNTNVQFSFATDARPDLSSEIGYWYQLNADTLLATDNPEVRFTNLRPGNYTFTLFAQRNGIRSEPEYLSFRIARPITEKPGFYLLLTGFALGMFAYFSQQHREQEKRRQQFLALRVQTVVNQLNPHFINNALGWVQARAQERGDAEAVTIIGKLAGNIKTIFQNSREKRAVHSLVEELTLVRNYLVIQKARFGEKLTCSLPAPEIVEQCCRHIKVPLMLVLIHCENAVEHGIRNQLSGGRVTINLQDSGDHLVITVEDTGVGRQRAREIGSLGNQQGISMLNELIHTLNKYNPLPIRQEFEDLPFHDDQGRPYGTRVTLTIPKTYHYAFAND